MSELLGIIVPIRKFMSNVDEIISLNEGGQEVLRFNGGREYCIPDFQREIRWNEDNISLLIDDLSTSPCYLGNIILTQHRNNTYSIIDGQQRITILIMILHMIKRLHGTRIDVMESCKLSVESFGGLFTLIENDFANEQIESKDIIDSDKLHQLSKYYSLWTYIKNHSRIKKQQSAQIILGNIEKSQVNLILNKSDDIKDGIRYFIDVNLKGKQLDAEDIFKSYLFKNDAGKDIRDSWYLFKTNAVHAEHNGIQYPLLKYLEHFFYCDLYKNPRYKGLEFIDDFTLKKEFKTKEEESQLYRKGSHIIEVISDKQYMQESFSRLNSVIAFMAEIAGTSSPSVTLKEFFKCVKPNGKTDKIDDKELVIIHNIIRKTLKDSNLLPKALIMKYILEVLIDKTPKIKDEYRKIYGVYLLAVLFIVFENTKSKEVLMSVLKANGAEWYQEAVSQIKSYFSLEKITDTRLLAQYKLATNENEEDYRFRCKSLATIYNYFQVTDSSIVIRNGMYKELNDFLTNDVKYSLEHFIVSQSDTKTSVITIQESTYNYVYEEKVFKKYVNSMFNFIFIPEGLNSSLGNNWLPQKLALIEKEDGLVINCSYSKMIIEKVKNLGDKLVATAPSIETCKDRLDLFFARDYRDLYVQFTKEVLEEIINHIKG